MPCPKVCIIILNWNGVTDTLECLQSLSSLNYSNYEAVVVDNGSTDMSVDIIRNRYPDLTIIESKHNLGYTGGNNLGIQYAMKGLADYIWILNNDTIIESDCLWKMIDAAESNKRIGLLSPIIYYNYQRDIIQSCGSFFNLKTGRIFADSMERNDRKVNPDHLIFVLYGTALLIRRGLIEKIGPFDDDFFAYFEDYDFSLRANKNAFRTMVVKSAKIYHKDASSTGGTRSPMRTYFYWRNLLLLYKKNFKGAAGFKMKYKHIRKSIGTAIFYRKIGNPLSADACLDGIWDGIFGIVGGKKAKGGMPIFLKRIVFLSNPTEKEKK